MKALLIALTLSCSFAVMAKGEMPSSANPCPIPVELPSIIDGTTSQTKIVFKVENILKADNVRYKAPVCIGLVMRDGSGRKPDPSIPKTCDVDYAPARCEYQSSNFKFVNEVQEQVDAGSLDNLCKILWDKYGDKEAYAGVDINCRVSENKIITPKVDKVPECSGEVSHVTVALMRGPTKEEISKKSCSTLNACIKGDSLSYFKRRTALKWFDYLDCN